MVFDRPLQCHEMSSVVVCLVSRLWHECIATKRLKLESTGFHGKVVQCLAFRWIKSITKFRKNFSSEGVKLQGGLRLLEAISRKRCEIEINQLINTVIGNHIRTFDLCKSRWPWMTLNGQNAYAIIGNEKLVRNGRLICQFYWYRISRFEIFLR